MPVLCDSVLLSYNYSSCVKEMLFAIKCRTKIKGTERQDKEQTVLLDILQ